MVLWLSFFLPADASAQTMVERGQWHLLLSGDALAAARYAIGAEMFRAGDAVGAGRGVPQNDAEVLWYRLAAEQGYAPAQTSLGYMYQHGRGVTQDDAEAVRWYWLAAEQGDADAQNNLGALCATGRGVQRDVVTAFAWFSVAALQGHAAAETNMLRLVDEMTRAEISLARAATADIQRRQANTTAESPQ